VCVCVCVYIYIYYTYIYIYIHTHTHTYVYKGFRVSGYIYMYVYTHTHTHTLKKKSNLIREGMGRTTKEEQNFRASNEGRMAAAEAANRRVFAEYDALPLHQVPGAVRQLQHLRYIYIYIS
jgi:hypothetical protein